MILLPPDNTANYVAFEDSKTPFWMLKKNGYYVVGSKNYAHKINALIEASRTCADVKWKFGNDVFDRVNWREPIETTITELYRMRAQQLRDQYDYLILAFSGGADSSNILDSFICNNIHLDEIIVHWPQSLTQGTYCVSTDTSPFNILSEWEFAVLPKLQQIQKNYPKIKITIDDLDDLSDEYSQDAITITKNKFHYLNIKRQRGIARRSSIIMNKTANMATIYGFEKPRLINVNNVLCAYFVDEMTSVVSDLSDGYERNIEFFYWTLQLPELPIKQCQMMYHFFKNHPHLCQQLNSKSLQNLNQPKIGNHPNVLAVDPEIMRNLTSQVLYPTWDPLTFQASKPKYFAFKCEYHAWISKNNQSHRFIESWNSAFSEYHKLIDPRFYLGDDGGYQSFSTKLYPLGLL